VDVEMAEKELDKHKCCYISVNGSMKKPRLSKTIALPMAGILCITLTYMVVGVASRRRDKEASAAMTAYALAAIEYTAQLKRATIVTPTDVLPFMPESQRRILDQLQRRREVKYTNFHWTSNASVDSLVVLKYPGRNGREIGVLASGARVYVRN
jgi:hypothetical protein